MIEKFAECITHGTFKSRQFNNDGIWTNCPICREEADVKQRALDNLQLIAENKVKQVNRMFANACIPPRFRTCTFDNYTITNDKQKNNVVKLRQYCFDFASETSYDLVLYGAVGTGKTHLANAVANSLIGRGYTAVYSTLYSIMDRLYEAGYEKQTEIAKFIEPDFLIIDEILPKLTDDTLLNLFKIIDLRYQAIRPTCLISNITIANLAEVLGERISDRVLSKVITLGFGWKTHRVQK